MQIILYAINTIHVNQKEDIFQQTSEVTKKEHLHSIKFSVCLHSYWSKYFISVLKDNYLLGKTMLATFTEKGYMITIHITFKHFIKSSDQNYSV